MVLCSGIDDGLYFCDGTQICVIYQVMRAFCCFGWTQVNFCFYFHRDILMSCNDMGEEAEKEDVTFTIHGLSGIFKLILVQECVCYHLLFHAPLLIQAQAG